MQKAPDSAHTSPGAVLQSFEPGHSLREELGPLLHSRSKRDGLGQRTAAVKGFPRFGGLSTYRSSKSIREVLERGAEWGGRSRMGRKTTSGHRGESACSHRPHSDALYKASASPFEAMLLCPHINGLAQQPPSWYLLPAFQGS